MLKKSHSIIILFVVVGALCGGAAGAFFGLTRDLPQIRGLEDFQPSAVSRIFSSDGALLDELFIHKRDPVPLSEIPPYLSQALLTTEDRQFYKHSGVDLKGILRAVVRNVKTGRFAQGASTLTQQLSRTLFLTPRKTLVRKIREGILALQLERRYTKDEILTLYLNQVYFGSGAYGVQSAATIFFNKNVRELNLEECALIAGMPQSPSRYSPLLNKGLATRRRNIVLRQMRDTGIITDAEYERAFRAPVITAPKSPRTRTAPFFVSFIKHELETEVGSDQLYKGGLTIETSLSQKLQVAAEQSIRQGLTDLKARMEKNGIGSPEPEAALIAIDIQTGGILAMVGGHDYLKSQFNRAISAIRQPGSAFKPFIYALAIERGFAQHQQILDAPVVFKGALKGTDWRPENFSTTYQGEITLRKALTHSKNIPAVRLIEMVGPDAVVRFARKLGISSPLETNLSIALGTSGANLLELTAAYAVFANGGQRTEPYGAMTVVQKNGRILWQARPEKTLALSATTAAIITDMLQGVIKEGTGKSALRLNRPVAGKTGTTNDYKDALFIGFSPDVAVGVWVGRDDHGTLGDGETGARAALPIWTMFMDQALSDTTYKRFNIPEDVVKMAMDPVTGRQISPDSPLAVPALFRMEMVPGK